jgi:hypothetical protein
MPYLVKVLVRGGSAEEHEVSGPMVDTRAEAEADLGKIRKGMARYEEQHDPAGAMEELPSWLVVNPALILSASVSGSG